MYLLCALVFLFSGAYCEKATCYYDGENVAILKGEINKQIGYAWAEWNDDIETTGTSNIVIETTDNTTSPITSAKKIYCAGYVDGYLMQYRIWNRWLLQKDILGVPRNESFSNTWTDWMNANIKYTRDQINENKDDPYWKSISLVLSQFDGLVDGYNKAVKDNDVPEQEMTIMDFWILQSIGDIYDLQAIWEPKKARDPFSFMECSGLVTILPDYSDVFFSHDTWSDYRKMSNTVKEYIFNGIEEWDNKRMVVTTKIGAIPSSEDFWITSNGLLILETTINNLNTTLQQEVKNSINTLMTWIRNYHASWVSNSAGQWADEFLKQNSGTYNNQYVIVDAKKITPKTKPTKDLIWVTETMPGIAVKGDVTEHFVEKKSFPSFNIPYFKEIYKIANYSKNAEISNTSSYDENPRFKIFERESPNVKDMESFKKVMRLNKYKDEEFSHDPGVQVFSRYDLRDPNPKAFGGLDTKITSGWRALNNMSFSGVWSPQYEDYEAWDFDSELNIGKFNKINHDGLPSKWKFPWRDFSGQNYSRCELAESQKDCFKISSCGWCTYNTHCYVGSKNGPALGVECIAGWSVPIEEKKGALAIIIPVTVISFLFCFAIYGYNLYIYCKNKKQETTYTQIN